MAIQSRSVSAAEHDWYATRSGLPSNAPLNDHKRAYYVSTTFVTGEGSKTINQMEWEWLKTLPGPVTSNEWADMWIQAVAGQGLTPVVKMDQNKFIFFTSVGDPYN